MPQRSPIRFAAIGLALLAGAVSQACGALIAGSQGYYEFVPSSASWSEARQLARARTHLGQAGYLATITTRRENALIVGAFGLDAPGQLAWFGGHEPVENEIWRWADGPESGSQMSLGEHPVAPNFFANWGGLEPTDSGGVGHDFAAINLGQTWQGIGSGQWLATTSTPGRANPVVGFVVEYPLAPAPSAVAVGAQGMLAGCLAAGGRGRRACQPATPQHNS